MRDPKEFEAKLWKALASDRTMMLGLDGIEDGHARPMSAHVEEGTHSIWFFTSRENALVQLLGRGNRAIATFAAKDHDLFATIQGRLTIDDDRATIDRLWNRYVAAWFEGGKEDPKLVLLRLDAEHAEVWLDASSVVAGIKLMLGVDPKKDYKDKVGHVSLQ